MFLRIRIDSALRVPKKQMNSGRLREFFIENQLEMWAKGEGGPTIRILRTSYKYGSLAPKHGRELLGDALEELLQMKGGYSVMSPDFMSVFSIF